MSFRSHLHLGIMGSLDSPSNFCLEWQFTWNAMASPHLHNPYPGPTITPFLPAHCVRGSSDNHVLFRCVEFIFTQRSKSHYHFSWKSKGTADDFHFIQCLLLQACNLSYWGDWRRKTSKFYASPGYKVLTSTVYLSNLVRLSLSVIHYSVDLWHC